MRSDGRGCGSFGLGSRSACQMSYAIVGIAGAIHLLFAATTVISVGALRIYRWTGKAPWEDAEYGRQTEEENGKRIWDSDVRNVDGDEDAQDDDNATVVRGWKSPASTVDGLEDPFVDPPSAGSVRQKYAPFHFVIEPPSPQESPLRYPLGLGSGKARRSSRQKQVNAFDEDTGYRGAEQR